MDVLLLLLCCCCATVEVQLLMVVVEEPYTMVNAFFNTHSLFNDVSNYLSYILSEGGCTA